MIKHIRVRSHTGEAFLENAFNIEVHEKLGDYSTLSFSLPFKDPKCEFIKIEAEIIFEDKRYRITEINDTRTEEGVETKEVLAEEAFLELAWYARPKTYKVTQKTISAGITQILSGTGWTKGIVENEDPNKLYSLTLENSTVLAILRQWAAITQKEIVFDTVNKKVSFVDRVGTNRGAMLRYRKNLKGIKCTIQPVQATVLYPYGKDGLDIRGVNNNIPYIEDYSWYTQQGIPLDEARNKYKKEYIWVNESIETAWTLLDSAISVLKNLSRPAITYECSVLDLENISPFDKLCLGDDVKVHDEVLGIDINTRVVEIVRHIDNPAENEIVLGNSVPGLEDAGFSTLSSTAGGGGVAIETRLAFLRFENADAITCDTNSGTPRFSMRFAVNGGGNAIMGMSITGETSTNNTIYVQVKQNGVALMPIIKQTTNIGFNHIGIPIALIGITDETQQVDVYIWTSSGTFSVPSKSLQAYIAAADLWSGSSPLIGGEEIVFIPNVDSSVSITLM